MKDQTEKQRHEDFRKRLWVGVAIAVARSDTTTRKDSPETWADEVLAAFDKKFPDPEERNTQ